MHITIHNLKQYSLQAVFDHVAEHMLTQGEPAVQEDTGSCQYRNADGLKCAVGFLIPDDTYAKLADAVEGAAIGSPIFDQYFAPVDRVYARTRQHPNADIFNKDFGDYRDNDAAIAADKYRALLADLQSVHDEAADYRYESNYTTYVKQLWFRKLAALANKYGLNADAVTASA